MKFKKLLIICILMITFVINISACSNKAVDTNIQQVDEQEETNQQATIEQAIPMANPEATVDALIGQWVDVSSAERFAKISKSENTFQYEDNEGKYPATFENGILKVKVSDTDVVDVYLDAQSGHIFTDYQGNSSEYSKKIVE